MPENLNCKESVLVEKVKELEEAKEAVVFCLNHVNGNVNMHGLKYWAERVENLRKDITELL